MRLLFLLIKEKIKKNEVTIAVNSYFKGSKTFTSKHYYANQLLQAECVPVEQTVGFVCCLQMRLIGRAYVFQFQHNNFLLLGNDHVDSFIMSVLSLILTF
jgi:hypothetical protein